MTDMHPKYLYQDPTHYTQADYSAMPWDDADKHSDRLHNGQVHALLAVADELRALRELLAERLTGPRVTENVTINATDAEAAENLAAGLRKFGMHA